MPKTNTISPFGKSVLVALYGLGAQTGQPYETDLATIGRQAGLTEGYDYLVEKTLRELVQQGFSIEVAGQAIMGSYLTKVELIGEQRAVVTLGVPKEALAFIDAAAVGH